MNTTKNLVSKALRLLKQAGYEAKLQPVAEVNINRPGGFWWQETLLSQKTAERLFDARCRYADRLRQQKRRNPRSKRA